MPSLVLGTRPTRPGTAPKVTRIILTTSYNNMDINTPLPAVLPTTGRRSTRLGVACRGLLWQLLLVLAVDTLPVQASMFKGAALDKAADVLSWVVLALVPIVGIAVFWLVHILPEKIAEKRKHPQAKAIQTLCLLSLFFGGMLWPLAWLWAYTKPVLYKLAYGTDTAEPDHGHSHQPAATNDAKEVQRLRARLAELEGKLDTGATTAGGKV